MTTAAVFILLGFLLIGALLDGKRTRARQRAKLNSYPQAIKMKGQHKTRTL